MYAVVEPALAWDPSSLVGVGSVALDKLEEMYYRYVYLCVYMIYDIYYVSLYVRMAMCTVYEFSRLLSQHCVHI